MYCDTRGTDKTNPDKTPGQKPPRTIEIEFVQRTFVRDFCTRPTKNGGSEMCDVLSGGPGMCDRGRGSKLAKNSVTYFMDGPKAEIRLYDSNLFKLYSTVCTISRLIYITNLYGRKIPTFSVQRRNSGRKDANFFA